MSNYYIRPTVPKLVFSNFSNTGLSHLRKDEAAFDNQACNTTKQTITTKANTNNERSTSYQPFYLNTESDDSTSLIKTKNDFGFKFNVGNLEPKIVLKEHLNSRRSLKATIQKLVNKSNIKSECKSYTDKSTSLKLTMTQILKSKLKVDEEAKRCSNFSINKVDSTLAKSIKTIENYLFEDQRPQNMYTELMAINLSEEELRMLKDDCTYFLPSNISIDTSKISKTYQLSERINEEEERIIKGYQYKISNSQLNRLKILKIMNATYSKPLVDEKKFYEQVQLYNMDKADNEESTRLKLLDEKMEKSIDLFNKRLLASELEFRRKQSNKFNRTEECMSRIEKIMKSSTAKNFTFKLGNLPKFEAHKFNFRKITESKPLKLIKQKIMTDVPDNAKIINRIKEEEEMKQTTRLKLKVIENYNIK